MRGCLSLGASGEAQLALFAYPDRTCSPPRPHPSLRQGPCSSALTAPCREAAARRNLGRWTTSSRRALDLANPVRSVPQALGPLDLLKRGPKRQATAVTTRI